MTPPLQVFSTSTKVIWKVLGQCVMNKGPNGNLEEGFGLILQKSSQGRYQRWKDL